MRELRQSTQLCDVLLSLNAAPTVQVDSASSWQAQWLSRHKDTIAVYLSTAILQPFISHCIFWFTGCPSLGPNRGHGMWTIHSIAWRDNLWRWSPPFNFSSPCETWRPCRALTRILSYEVTSLQEKWISSRPKTFYLNMHVHMYRHIYVPRTNYHVVHAHRCTWSKHQYSLEWIWVIADRGILRLALPAN